MEDYKFSFWNSPDKPTDIHRVFGCTSHGFSNAEKCIYPNEYGSMVWEHKLPGEVFDGTYQFVIDCLSALSSVPKICIVLYKKAEGFEEFLSQATNTLPGTLFIGGGAAFVTDFAEGELLPEAADVCVLAVSGSNYKVDTLNIYEETKLHVEIKATSKRVISKIKELPNGEWQNAISYYKNKQIKFGVEPDIFENLCFSDKNRRNLHCSISDNGLFVGANLPDDNLLTLNYISCNKAAEKLKDFIDDTDSLIFGCAGIRSLVDQNVFTGAKSLVGFMFGEIITYGEKAVLGNLMLTKLKVL